MENVFLTEGKGITSTSANYLANIAKETLKQAESQLNNLSFVTQEVELINGTKKVLRRGRTSVNSESLLKRIANMHSFIAWIREAIKFKDSLLEEIKNLNSKRFAAEKFNLELPQCEETKDLLTENDIISEMNIKERNQYLTLEAFASTFGEYIHPEGKISNAREEVLFRTQLPCEVNGEGRDMVIYTYTPEISVSEIDSSFMNLQSQYREYERQLNAIKFSIKEKLNKRNLEINLYNKKVKEDYDRKSSIFLEELSNRVRVEQERISKLKIIIPEKLQDTYEYLESLGNK